MKMTADHYTILKDQIFNGVSNNGDKLSNIDFVVRWNKLYNDYTETRKLWDLYWACGGSNWKRVAFDGNPYGGDYNDKHIETALKKIYRELAK